MHLLQLDCSSFTLKSRLNQKYLLKLAKKSISNQVYLTPQVKKTVFSHVFMHNLELCYSHF